MPARVEATRPGALASAGHRRIPPLQAACLASALGYAMCALGCRGGSPADDGRDARSASGTAVSSTSARPLTPPSGLGTSATSQGDGSSAPSSTRASHGLDELLIRCAEQDGPRAAECDEPLQQLAKKLALLEVGGVSHEASHVYFCRELGRERRERDPWWCRSAATHADDTLHTTEFPHDTVELALAEQVRLVDDRRRPAAQLIKVGAGQALELHGDGYVAARRLDIAKGGRLSVATIPAGKHVLLFALFRHDAHWVRKHVWVLRRR